MARKTIKKRSTEVLQYSVDGEFLERYPTKEEACEALGLGPKALNTVLSRYAYSAAGFLWIFHDDLHLLSFGAFKESYINSRKKPGFKGNVTRRGMPIVQVDIDTGYIFEEFPNMKQAALAMNQINASAISRCCTGQIPTAYGFKWMTKADHEKKYPQFIEEE